MRAESLRNYAVTVLVLTLAVVSGAVGWKAYRLIIHADDLVRESRVAVKNTSQNANAVLLQLGIMADQAALASRVTKEAAEEQKKLIAATSDNVRQASADLDRLILHADASLNQDLFPQMSATLATANLELMRGGDDAHDTFLATQKALATADQRLDDPEIARTLHNVQLMTGHLEQTTGAINGVVQKAVKPRARIVSLLEIMFGIATKSGSMVGGFGR